MTVRHATALLKHGRQLTGWPANWCRVKVCPLVESRSRRRFELSVLGCNIRGKRETGFPRPARHEPARDRSRSRARSLRAADAHRGGRHGDGVGGAPEGHARLPEDRRRQDDAAEAERGRPVREDVPRRSVARVEGASPQRRRDPRPGRARRRAVPGDGVDRRRSAQSADEGRQADRAACPPRSRPAS